MGLVNEMLAEQYLDKWPLLLKWFRSKNRPLHHVGARSAAVGVAGDEKTVSVS